MAFPKRQCVGPAATSSSSHPRVPLILTHLHKCSSARPRPVAPPVGCSSLLHFSSSLSMTRRRRIEVLVLLVSPSSISNSSPPGRIFRAIATISAMGTEVVRPRDCLLRRTRNPSARRLVGSRNESLREAKPRKREATLAAVGSECFSGRMARDAAALREVRVKTFSTPPRDVYAGSACTLSPSPRALPLPRFSRRKEESPSSATSVDPFATRDLRRLLRLE